jgi:hypothetical protein
MRLQTWLRTTYVDFSNMADMGGDLSHGRQGFIIQDLRRKATIFKHGKQA